MNITHPTLPLPEPLRGAETGTFAHDTVVRRMPEIVRRVMAENGFQPEIMAALDELARDMPHGLVRPLRDTWAPDAALWAGYVSPYVGMSWLDAPWFFAETYMFRRVLEATGYFGAGPGAGADPYALQKAAGLELGARSWGLGARASAHGSARADGPAALVSIPESLAPLLAASLWGNQADLSLWPAEEGGRPQGDAAPRAERLLRDDTTALVAHIAGLSGMAARVDIVLDNAGLELLGDLALADCLLALDINVALHAKPHPTYVSDVTAPDVGAAVEWLLAHPDTAAAALGARMAAGLSGGRLAVRADWFWTSPLAGWELPGALRAELAGSGLVISKGDANYRRWLGDRHWPYDAPLQQVLAYAPAPLALLRTCKSEVAAGIAPAQLARAAAEDPGWRTGGRWGVIQFHR